ncbi:MAG TPA: hypothetical protein VHN11_21170 [Xanthobacteraceae bacterium]|jgi:hypothetical protein|nr:hypothetical protein [Xanthobacteraceae bacterium]
MKSVLLFVILLIAGCASVENNLRKVPAFEFERWSHSDRYGVFTDNFAISGVKWTLTEDGWAVLEIDAYDGNAAWAGTVGPHDAISKLKVRFPPGSPQAKALAKEITPPTPK